MIKKIVVYISFFFLLFLNIILDLNIRNYISLLKKCFNRDIFLSTKYNGLISIVFALISTLIYIVILLAVFKNKEAQKGIKLKTENGTYGTAEWLTDNEAKTILGLNNEPGILLGKKNNRDIILPFSSYFNKNILVIGSSRKHEVNKLHSS
ncbi:MAG: hypothetical protein ACI4VO_00450 [Clostridia bacterium]